MIKTYIKKPIPVEAVQFTGMNESEISEFAKGKIWVNQQIDPNTKYIEKNPWNTLTRYSIDTLEGEMRFDVGDYIVKGVKGEFYAVDKEIFEETYEEAFVLDKENAPVVDEYFKSEWNDYFKEEK